VSADDRQGEVQVVKLGRAQLLMCRLIASGDITEQALADVLGVRLETMKRYLTDGAEIPLNRQARLALFVIARVPRFLREANRLRQQVAAAITYRARDRERYESSPPAQ
jgi:hypothetical protein